MFDKFKNLVEDAQRILVITHVGPDPDAFSSILLMGTTLELNYPSKDICISSEELIGDLTALAGYNKIRVQKLDAAIDSFKPDLIILLDAMNFKRATRGDYQAISSVVKERGIKLAIIDHHEKVGVEDCDAYINQLDPAATQTIYTTLFKELKLKKPEGCAQTTLTGIYSDTGGFIYKVQRYRETLSLVADLVDAGADLERIATLLNSYTSNIITAMSELMANISSKDDYSYSYVSDEFTKNWIDQGKEFEELKLGTSHFVNNYIRNIDGRGWGFVVYQDLPAGNDIYGVSLRSISGLQDVSVIANKLGGGGHKPAAGAKVQGSSIEEVIKLVQSTIEQMK